MLKYVYREEISNLCYIFIIKHKILQRKALINIPEQSDIYSSCNLSK